MTRRRTTERTIVASSVRSKKINQPVGVQTGKTQNCGKQSDVHKKAAPVKKK